MPLDGATLLCVKNELSKAKDCHIDKIHIPGKNEFVFAIRGKGFSKKLYISLSPDCPRISFTDISFENPQNPPMFCMLLRKHLASGRIVEIENVGAERLMIIKIQSTNEMGDRVLFSLVLEFIGHKTNLILLNDSGKIIDSLRRSDIESSQRLIQPGATYTLPENSGKTDILDDDFTATVDTILLTPEKKLSDCILNEFSGISPLIAREIAYRITGDTDSLVKDADKTAISKSLNDLKGEILSGGKPILLTDKKGMPKDFSFTEIKQYGEFYSMTVRTNFSELLQDFYGERERIRRLDSVKSELIKLVKNLIARNTKKLALRESDLKKSQNREELRIYGELIKANLYRIPKGASSVTVENYYDPQCKEVTVKLDCALSPTANAAKYFKNYKKSCTAATTLIELIEDCKKEGEYLESVLTFLNAAETTRDLAEIKSELISGGYIIQRGSVKKQNTASKPMKFEKNGFEIMVGKNNIQNDLLTLKIASKSDIWFHTKNIHGSHVILFTSGKEPDEEALIYAANLAAKYSKAANSSQVPVDYTPVKFVKKPAGAKPGMVIYTTNKTIFANPNNLE